MQATLRAWNSRVFQPIRKQKKTSPHSANSTAASAIQEAEKKKENWYRAPGRHSSVWLGRRPSLVYQTARSGTRRTRSASSSRAR